MPMAHLRAPPLEQLQMEIRTFETIDYYSFTIVQPNQQEEFVTLNVQNIDLLDFYINNISIPED